MSKKFKHQLQLAVAISRDDFKTVKELLENNQFPKILLSRSMDIAISSRSYKIIEMLGKYIDIPSFKMIKFWTDTKKIFWKSVAPPDTQSNVECSKVLKNEEATDFFEMMQKITRKQKIQKL